MFPTFLRLRGKTYDYKIMYTSVTRIFLLPKPDEIHVQLVVSTLVSSNKRYNSHLAA